MSIIAPRPTPRWSTLRHNDKQQEYYQSESRINVVPAGRRCLAEGTHVCTPSGPVPIENLRVGDKVIGFENGVPAVTTVAEIFDNGFQNVYALENYDHVYLKATDHHKLWACNDEHLAEGRFARRQVSELNSHFKVKKSYAEHLITGGTEAFPAAYSLGALIGTTWPSSDLVYEYEKRAKVLPIICRDERIPAKIAHQLGCRWMKNRDGSKHKYKILGDYDKLPFCDWFICVSAKRKNADWSVINTWNRSSCFDFLAGILDTCGSISYEGKNKSSVKMSISLQSKAVVQCCEKIIYKYFQEHVSVHKLKNKGTVYYTLKSTSTTLIKRILSALDGRVFKTIDTSTLKAINKLSGWIALKFDKDSPEEVHTYDIKVSNSTNLYVLHDGAIVTSNSGKCVARGTLVSMSDNTFKPVEQVRVGDYVWTLNQHSVFEPGKVEYAQLDSIRTCLRFTTWAGSLDVSPNHPFLVMDGSWRERHERWYAKWYNKPIPRSAMWKDAELLRVGDVVGIAGTCSSYAIELAQFEDREIDMTIMLQAAKSLNIDVLNPLPGNLLNAFFVTYNRMYAYKHGEVLKEPIIKAFGEKVTKYPLRLLFERMRVFKPNFPAVQYTKTFGEEVGGSVIWLPILSITETQRQEVFDLTIKDTHNFVANGYVTHNTELAKRRLVRRAVSRVIHGHGQYHNARFFAAAPTRDQAKRIYWNDLKAFVPAKYLAARPRETDLVILLHRDTQIHIIGMDKPERFEGAPWDGGILDEYGNMKESAWMENVFPALADRRGWVDLIGVPEGRNHYYDRWLEALACTDGTIRGHHWTSAEILPPEEIAMAKRMLDELSFKQEMEAEFVNFAGQCYYPFNAADHCRSLLYDKRAPLVFCFDFNVSPGVAVVIQEQVIPGSFELVQRPEYGLGQEGLTKALKAGPDAMMSVPVVGTGIIGEVHIKTNSNTPAVCNKLLYDWGDHEGQILLYGDATGGSRGTAKVSGSDWDIIWSIMCDHYGESRVFMEVSKVNPSERSRVNAVNTRLKSLDGTVRMAVDPAHCPNVIRDFEGVRVLEGGAGEIDKKHDPALTHMCFSGNTLVPTGKGIQRLSEIPSCGTIRTWNGELHPYKAAMLTTHNTEVVKVRTALGDTICTPEHPYLTTEGWVCAKFLEGKKLITADALLCAMKENKFFRDYLTKEQTDPGATSSALLTLVNNISIELYGFFTTEKFQKDITCITWTEIDQITRSTILSCCHNTITSHDTLKVLLRKSLDAVLLALEKEQTRPQLGMELPMGGCGIQNMPREQKRQKCSAFASGVERNFLQSNETLNFAGKTVRHGIDITPELMTRCVLACIVDLLFSQTSTHPQGIAPESALRIVTNVAELADPIDVYCLSVPNQGCFCLEDGEIVSNSDALGYYIASEFPVLEETIGNFRVGGRF